MNCPHCGRSVPDEQKFCPQCGAKTQQPAPAKRPTARIIRNQENAGWKMFAYVIAALVALFFALTFFQTYRIHKNIEAAKLDIKIGDFDDCTRRLEKVVAKRPKLKEPWVLLATCYIELGKPEKAVKTVEDSMKWAPGNSDAFALLGWMQFTKNDFKTSEKNLKKALKVQPANRLANQYYGLLLLQNGKPKTALKYLRPALKDAERIDRIDINKKIASIYYASGKYEESKNFYLDALKDDLNMVDASSGLVECYLALGHYKDAKKEIDRAVEIDPGNNGLKELKTRTYALAEKTEVLEYLVRRRVCDRNYLFVYETFQNTLARINDTPSAFMGKNVPEVSAMLDDSKTVYKCYQSLKIKSDVYYIINSKSLATANMLSGTIEALIRYLSTSDPVDSQNLRMQIQTLEKNMEEMAEQWKNEQGDKKLKAAINEAERLEAEGAAAATTTQSIPVPPVATESKKKREPAKNRGK